MEKKDALMHSLAELKAAHDKASAELAEILIIAAQAMKGREVLPSITGLRHYKQAIAAAKAHATQAEMIVVEYTVPRTQPDLSMQHGYWQ